MKKVKTFLISPSVVELDGKRPARVSERNFFGRIQLAMKLCNSLVLDKNNAIEQVFTSPDGGLLYITSKDGRFKELRNLPQSPEFANFIVSLMVSHSFAYENHPDRNGCNFDYLLQSVLYELP